MAKARARASFWLRRRPVSRRRGPAAAPAGLRGAWPLRPHRAARLGLLGATALSLALVALADPRSALAACTAPTGGDDVITCTDPIAAGDLNADVGNDSVTLTS